MEGSIKRLMKKWYLRLCHFKKKIRENDLSIYASAMAFFLLLSFIPTFLLIFSLLPFINVTAGDILDVMKRIFPQDLYDITEKMVAQIYARSAKKASFAGLFSLWSSGKGMMAFIQSLNKIHGRKEERGYIKLRLMASSYTLLMLLIFMISIYLKMFGSLLYRYVTSSVMDILSLEVLTQGKALFLFLFLFLLCLSCYTFLPSDKVSMKSQIPGAFLAVVLWFFFSFGFSFYVRRVQEFTAYGTFGGILLFLLWLYFCSFILLLGSLLNQEIVIIKKIKL